MTKRKSTLVPVFPGIDHPNVVAAARAEAAAAEARSKALLNRLFLATALVATSRSAVELFDNSADQPVDTVYLKRTLKLALDELESVHSELSDSEEVLP